MLFNSFEFILIFLPITLTGYFLCARAGRNLAYAFLTVASFVFYGAWSVPYGILLVIQLTANFLIGRYLSQRPNARAVKVIMIIGVTLNLTLLGYFKYANFFIKTASGVFGGSFDYFEIILPLAISFHTFQQIAYLVDEYRGKAPRYTYLEYVLFVLFFPQLIAGPIVHHWQLIGEFQKSRMRFDAADFSSGLTFFVLGLSKKVLIADQIASLADPVFDGALLVQPDFVAAWIAVLAFGLGLYFDFSGYSDMAVGLARMFGIRLPYNFNSPYQSASIIDFWKRWHITLSVWLRDYLYVPLGGNRRGPIRRHANLMITMLLGGLWHGASWNFVVWGGLHGLYLIINHSWRRWRRHPHVSSAPHAAASWMITMIAVGVAWVFFRSPSLAHSGAMLWGLAGQAGLAGQSAQALLNLPEHFHALNWVMQMSALASVGLVQSNSAILIVAWFVACALPNSQEIIDGSQDREVRRHSIRWRPDAKWAAGLAFLTLLSLTHLTVVREFAYFQF